VASGSASFSLDSKRRRFCRNMILGSNLLSAMVLDPHEQAGRQPASAADHKGKDGRSKWLFGLVGVLLVSGPWLRRVLSKPPRASERFVVERSMAEVPVEPHERSDANALWIIGIVLFLFLGGLGLHWILAGFLGALKQSPEPKDAWQPIQRRTETLAARPTYPRLQVSPPLDLQTFRTREENKLGTYGWIDRTSGVVRVPIERAMELVLAQGLPTRSNADSKTNHAGPSSYQLMQQRPEHRQPEIQGEK
jgi:hypothetical protein